MHRDSETKETQIQTIGGRGEISCRIKHSICQNREEHKLLATYDHAIEGKTITLSS